MRVISYGGGVQSTALLILAAQGELGTVDAALFANVGEDSEHPATLAYVREVAKVRSAVPVIELQRTGRDGLPRTLWRELMRTSSRSISIPVRMAESGAPGRRRCTTDYKMAVIGRYLKAHGASSETPASVLIGISWDEVERLSNRCANAWEQVEYPLIDRRITREACKALIVKARWPIPGKSACFFCPFRRPSEFARMRRDEPALFTRAALLETTLNHRRAHLGKDPVYLTRFSQPLATAIATADPELDFGTGPGETCDAGYCWT